MADEMKRDIEALQSTMRRVAAELSRNGAKLDDLQSLAISTKSSVDRLTGVVESFAKDVEGAQRDRKTASDAYMQHQQRLEDHETRLSRLEARKG